MISEQLQKKINQSIALLQSVGKQYDGEIEIAYSGGKDSDVILQLAKEAGIRYRAIYKNTTIDPPGTIRHVQEMNVDMRRPKMTFFQLVAKKGFPSRLHRFCCEYLKEYKVLDKTVIGVRKAESTKRAARYNEPTECRWYGAKTEKNHVEQIYPILEWTDDDVLEFVLDRKLKLAPVYYNRGGQIDVTKRLGCMGCPLQSQRKRIQFFKENTRFLRAYLRAGKKYMDTHPDSKVCKINVDVYAWFCRDVFFSSEAERQANENSLFGRPDYKALLEEYFGTDLTV